MKEIAILFAVVMVAGSAYAFGGMDGPCKADIAKFCKDVEKGEGRIINCLKDHSDELSSACKSKIVEQKEKSQK